MAVTIACSYDIDYVYNITQKWAFWRQNDKIVTYRGVGLV